MNRSSCYLHAGVDSVATCHGCLKPICAPCMLVEGQIEYCASCVVAVRRRARAGKSAVVVGLLLLLGGAGSAIGWLATRPKPAPPAPLPPPKYGQYTIAIEEGRKKLAAEPCDRKAAFGVSQALLKADVPREALEHVDAFVAKCGSFERLQWDKFSAHKQLSEWPKAVEAATALMELNPTDYDYPWWRGEMYEQQGQLEEAIVDYRLAISLLPRMNSVPFKLMDALIKVGRPCEGIEALNVFLHFHPDAQNAAAVVSRRAKFEAEKCDEPGGGQGKAMFSAPQGATSFKAQVKLNGKVTASFIVDTGATLVTLPRALAASLELGPPMGKVRLRTAAGLRTGELHTLETVQTQGAQAKRVQAVVMDELGDEGLLGLSFLSRFKVAIDPKKRTLSLSPRD